MRNQLTNNWFFNFKQTLQSRVFFVVSLHKIIRKVEELTIIIEKWRKLNQAKKNLTGFQLGNDGLSSTITLKDAASREFKTSHNLLVTTVLETLQQVLDEKIIEVEAQIDFVS